MVFDIRHNLFDKEIRDGALHLHLVDGLRIFSIATRQILIQCVMEGDFS